MGVLDAIERQQTGMGAMHYVNAQGKRLAAMPADLFAGDVEILRADLVRILYDASLAQGVEYHFGDSISGITEEPHGVTVTFERAPTRRFDLVVGADGHSTVRALTFGPESGHVHHLGVHCAVFPVANYLGLDHTGLVYRTPSKVVTVASARHNAEARAMLFFGTPTLDYERRDIGQQKRLVADAFAEVGWETPNLLAAMWQTHELYFDSVAQVRLDRWSKGRVALLGDAAYSPSLLSGMGSGLAVVGAYVLAGELAATGGDHRVAYAHYEQIMRPYVHRAQRSGATISRFMVPKGQLLTALLNRYVRLIPYLPGKQLVANTARRTAEAVELRDYP